MIDVRNDCWVLHDGAAGNARQARALAEALGRDAREIVLAPRAPWRWWAPRRGPGATHAFGTALADATAPALAIGCGRQAALATRLLRERGSRVVQILDPRLDPQLWDWVVAPVHDGLHGDNVLTLTGSLNPVDDAWLARALATRPELAGLPSPRTTVLLGGRTPAVRFDRGAFEVLAARLERWRAAEGGSLLVLGSPRTDPAIAALARAYWADVPGLRWFDGSDGANPYAAALAAAERIVVSPDSVNMVSEACATHAPVYVAEPDRARGRVRCFLDDLLARGRIRPLLTLPADFVASPLRETARLARDLRQKLQAVS